MLYGKKFIGTIGAMGGVPAVLSKFCWAWGEMIQYNCEYLCDPGELIHYPPASISWHSQARNSLVEQMQGDWLLQLDTDHEFEPDLAARMYFAMQRHNVDVLSGMYQFKNPPYSPVAFNRDGKICKPLGDWDRSVPIHPIGWTGGGCLMVRRKVFDAIRSLLKENPFDIRNSSTVIRSEDASFFDRCWDLGIKAYLATSIESPHLVIRPITLEDYKPDRSVMTERIPVEGKTLVWQPS